MPVKQKIQKVSREGRRPVTLIVALCILAALVLGGTLAYIVDRTVPVRNQFVNGLPAVGDLAIHKTVSHPFGPDYTVPDNDNTTFHFLVDLGVENAGKTYSGYTADDQGVIRLTVKAGQTVSLEELPAGAVVTVTEEGGNTGFAVQASQTVTIVRDSVQTVNFVNPYTPAAAPHTERVTGEKRLVGRDWMEGDSFTFRLERFADGEWISLGERTITAAFDQEGVLIPESVCFDFTELMQAVIFDHAGTYSFRVTEVEGTIGGIAYDNAESLFDVVVTDVDMDGSLEINVITTTTPANTSISETNVAVLFENQYAPAGSTEVLIEIVKTLEDLSGAGRLPEGFVFVLEDEAGNVIAQSDPTNAAGQTSIRLVYEPEDAGQTFRYVLKERDDGQTGMTYDDTEHIILVRVFDNLDGTVSATVEELNENGDAVPGTPDQPDGEAGQRSETPDQPEQRSEEPQEAETSEEPEASEEPPAAKDPAQIPQAAVIRVTFENVYDPADAEIQIYGNKELIGRDLRADEFRFHLYRTDATFDPASGEWIQSATNKESGGIYYLPITFDKVGTYYYAIVEEKEPAVSGVSYDPRNWNVTVTVTDKNGVLEATWTAVDSLGQRGSILFHNVYEPGSVLLTLNGEKQLTGLELGDRRFVFELYEADSEFHPGEAPIQTVENGADGIFTFRELRFTKVGTWYYVVRESGKNPEPGIAYDQTEYRITVTVTDDGEGSLHAAVGMRAWLNGEAAEAQSLVFRNLYSANYATVTLNGKKHLQGANLKAEQFTFELYEADADFNPAEEPISKVTNDADGVFTFNTLTFPEAGTYYYVVKENRADALENITYDQGEYQVTVTVTDDGSGVLQAVCKLTRKGSGEANEIRFTNVYKSPGGLPPTGDQNDATLWYVLLGVSLCGLVILLVYALRQRGKKRKDS